jgi:hypothetical protein
MWCRLPVLQLSGGGPARSDPLSPAASRTADATRPVGSGSRSSAPAGCGSGARTVAAPSPPPSPASTRASSGPAATSRPNGEPVATRRRWASSQAAPTVGWPANGSSVAGVKIRSRVPWLPPASTNTVSDRCSSRAIVCMAPAEGSGPSSASTTASGLPA